MDLGNPFETMLVNVGTLQVPPSIGCMVIFTDGKTTKAVWNNLPGDAPLRLIEFVRSTIAEKESAGTLASGPSQQKPS